MIEKMHKLHLVINSSKLHSTLDHLQNLGMVHLTTKPLPESIDQKFKEKQQKIQAFLKYFKNASTNIERIGDPDVVLLKFEDTLKELSQLEIDLKKIEKADQELSTWGSFDLGIIKKLQTNINLKFYTLTPKLFKSADFKDYQVFIINGKGPLNIMVASTKSIELPFNEVVLTDNSIRKNELLTKISECKKELDKMVEFAPFLKKEFINSTNLAAFDTAEHSTISYYDSFYSLSGWIPDGNLNYVTGFLDNMEGIAYITTNDTSEIPPVKLKNKPWFKIFEPITKLFDLPNYAELDLTPLFAPFFVLFFGMCFGDACYGLVLCIASIIGFIKSKKLAPLFAVGIIFGISTTICGLLMGGFLGYSMFSESTPPLILQLFKKYAVFDSTQVFYLALLIGLFQILFGMLTNMVNRIYQEKNILAGLAPFGWFLLFSFLSVLYLSAKDPAKQSGFYIGEVIITFCSNLSPNFIYVMIGLAVLLILFFNDLKANIFLRFGKGLWALYGITGKLGDLLSYVRLFALGLSGATLGLVINQMSSQLLDLPPVIGHLLFIICMTLGHGLNFALNILGSFVHPLRLTFVEFYGNAGFSGGGKAYKPFTKNKE